MKSKKAKKVYLADDDLDLLKALKGEFSDEKLDVSDGFIVSMGLKALKEQGGALKTFKEGGSKRGKKRQTT